MSTLLNLSPLPLKLKNYLYKVGGVAIANKKYRWGIDIIEKYAGRYSLSNNEKYKLGLLYDHLAMKTRGSLKNRYLQKAEATYKKILKQNPKYFLALYGIGRTYSIRGNYDKALYYQSKAYQKMMKLPRNQRGALAIGVLYQKKRDYKNAEKWYLREYKNCPQNDFGTTLNLFNFYKGVKNYPKALFYGLKTEELIKTEFKKRIYRGLKMENSDFLKQIWEEIREIKLLAKK